MKIDSNDLQNYIKYQYLILLFKLDIEINNNLDFFLLILPQNQLIKCCRYELVLFSYLKFPLASKAECTSSN